MSPQRPLSEFVKPADVSTAALHLEWHSVRRRVQRRKQMRVAMAVVPGVALLVAAAFALRPGPDAFVPGQVVLTDESARTLRLAEGSTVFVASNSGVELSRADTNEVVVVLDHGRSLFDVEKNPGRRFVVKADGVEVRVIGTRFTVQRNGKDVSVQVERGIVEVRDGDSVQRLERGASWKRAKTGVAEAPAVPSEDAVEEFEDETIGEAPAVGEEQQPSAPVKQKTKKRRTVTAKKSEPVDEAPTPVASGGSSLDPAPPLQPQFQAKPVEPSPAEAFNNAMRDRAEGRSKDAIIGFQQVCERWPSSAYAPMSAFEWGRLALDVQNDPRQAARAFERTLELATSASLIEDALARLTEAYARYDVGSCRRVQADYLRRFPDGPHVRGVTKACPP